MSTITPNSPRIPVLLTVLALILAGSKVLDALASPTAIQPRSLAHLVQGILGHDAPSAVATTGTQTRGERRKAAAMTPAHVHAECIPAAAAVEHVCDDNSSSHEDTSRYERNDSGNAAGDSLSDMTNHMRVAGTSMDHIAELPVPGLSCTPEETSVDRGAHQAAKGADVAAQDRLENACPTVAATMLATTSAAGAVAATLSTKHETVIDTRRTQVSATVSLAVKESHHCSTIGGDAASPQQPRQPQKKWWIVCQDALKRVDMDNCNLCQATCAQQAGVGGTTAIIITPENKNMGPSRRDTLRQPGSQEQMQIDNRPLAAQKAENQDHHYRDSDSSCNGKHHQAPPTRPKSADDHCDNVAKSTNDTDVACAPQFDVQADHVGHDCSMTRKDEVQHKHEDAGHCVAVFNVDMKHAGQSPDRLKSMISGKHGDAQSVGLHVQEMQKQPKQQQQGTERPPAHQDRVSHLFKEHLLLSSLPEADGQKEDSSTTLGEQQQGRLITESDANAAEGCAYYGRNDSGHAASLDSGDSNSRSVRENDSKAHVRVAAAASPTAERDAVQPAPAANSLDETLGDKGAHGAVDSPREAKHKRGRGKRMIDSLKHVCGRLVLGKQSSKSMNKTAAVISGRSSEKKDMPQTAVGVQVPQETVEKKSGLPEPGQGQQKQDCHAKCEAKTFVGHGMDSHALVGVRTVEDQKESSIAPAHAPLLGVISSPRQPSMPTEETDTTTDAVPARNVKQICTITEQAHATTTTPSKPSAATATDVTMEQAPAPASNEKQPLKTASVNYEIDIIRYTFKCIRKLGDAHSFRPIFVGKETDLVWASLFDSMSGTRLVKRPIQKFIKRTGIKPEPGHLLTGLIRWLEARFQEVPLIGVDAAVRLGWNMLACRHKNRTIDPVELLDELQDHILTNKRLQFDVEIGIEFWGFSKLILSELRSLYTPNLGMDSGLAFAANALLCLSYPGGPNQAEEQRLSGIGIEVYIDITKWGTKVFKDILTAFCLPVLDIERKEVRWNFEKFPLVD